MWRQLDLLLWQWYFLLRPLSALTADRGEERTLKGGAQIFLAMPANLINEITAGDDASVEVDLATIVQKGKGFDHGYRKFDH